MSAGNTMAHSTLTKLELIYARCNPANKLYPSFRKYFSKTASISVPSISKKPENIGNANQCVIHLAPTKKLDHEDSDAIWDKLTANMQTLQISPQNSPRKSPTIKTGPIPKDDDDFIWNSLVSGTGVNGGNGNKNLENIAKKYAEIDINPPQDYSIAKQVELLQKSKQIVQRTPEWYAVRQKMLTASEVSSVLPKTRKICDLYIKEFPATDLSDCSDSSDSKGTNNDKGAKKEKQSLEKYCNPYSTKEQVLARKKTQTEFVGNIATRWGQKYEAVAAGIYSRAGNKKLLEFGLLQHKDYPWLGASPDGITQDGVLIEIKCPFRRKLGKTPPFYYWIQVQIQLEVCDLEVCDYIECTFSEPSTLNDATFTANSANTQGIIIQNTPIVGTCYDWDNSTYVYPPITIHKPSKILEWANSKKKELSGLPAGRSAYVKSLYWKLEDYQVISIKRNREWFAQALPFLHETFKTISTS